MTTTQTPSNAGRLYLAAIGLSLAIMGGVTCWFMWRTFNRAVQMQSWPQVRCAILSSDIEERRIDPNSPPEFRLNMTYGYNFGGKAYTGNQITRRENPWTSKSDVVEKWQATFKAGTNTTCRVDPNSPEFSVLKLDSKASGYSIWFPALFVVGGLGITIRAITAKRPL